MNTNTSGLCFMLLAILLQGIPGFSQEGVPSQELPSHSLERTEVRKFHSDIIGLDFELWISLPWSYHAGDTIEYPVIYETDPYRQFSIMKGLSDVLSYPLPYMKEVIIVGIGYGGTGQEATLNWVLGRIRDYTPVFDIDMEELYKSRLASMGISDVEVQTGGAPLYLEFLSDELIPFIESTFPADSSTRMLTGYSLGGLLGMYVLFQKPELFDKYFIGSPSIHYADDITFEYEGRYARQHSDLHAEVFLTAGALEERTSKNVMRMEELLLSRNYPNLIMNTVIFEKESHASCFPGALSRSLIELLGD